MHMSLKPATAAGSLLIHGTIILLLLAAAPERPLGAGCPQCDGVFYGAGPAHWWPTEEVLKLPLPQERVRNCPSRSDQDHPAALMSGERLPSVSVLPVMLCAKIGRDGGVVAVRLDDKVAAERERDAVAAFRKLRFAPAISHGKPVSSWLRLTLSQDPEPSLIL